MADTGFNWAATAELDAMGSVADGADDTSPALDLDGKAACQIGLTILASDVAVDGVVTIFVLGCVDDVNYETMTDGSAWSFTVTPEQDATVYKVFSVDPSMYAKFKIGVSNESGPALTFTIDYYTATIPVASA